MCESHDRLVRWHEERQLVVGNAKFVRERRLSGVGEVDARRRLDGEEIHQGRSRSHCWYKNRVLGRRAGHALWR